MAYKAYVYGVTQPNPGQNVMSTNISWVDTTTSLVVDVNNFFLTFGIEITQYSLAEMVSALTTIILAESVTQGYGMTVADIIWLSPFSPVRSFNFTPSRSIVTGTGATGFQVSSTRDAFVTYSPKITTTATIAGGQEGYVVLEIAPTNSATAGDWKEVGRVTNGQALSLALTLQSVQPVGSPLCAWIPAGYYAKLRSVNTTGTPAYIVTSGQEVLQ